ncbi:hypothetical protein [Kitasatospora cathayae]|uniref:WD40 repeat domain-containing protein n=1 Tax=Kitasatospora cathayae TaxID=3004092 RepID=A0ABY7PWU8_9ACTN|nr:hypothetical protein [Kitasatospora sp. HUAS 3-15]WBP84654.1 hypothetical protein O1G21_01495 [Kitasatospora sp. HUAS 3-15]
MAVNERVVAVTAALDRTARVWDVATGRQIDGALHEHTAQVSDVATATVDGRPVAVTAERTTPCAPGTSVEPVTDTGPSSAAVTEQCSL